MNSAVYSVNLQPWSPSKGTHKPSPPIPPAKEKQKKTKTNTKTPLSSHQRNGPKNRRQHRRHSRQRRRRPTRTNEILVPRLRQSMARRQNVWRPYGTWANPDRKIPPPNPHLLLYPSIHPSTKPQTRRKEKKLMKNPLPPSHLDILPIMGPDRRIN